MAMRSVADVARETRAVGYTVTLPTQRLLAYPAE